jgi:hypothetical protein
MQAEAPSLILGEQDPRHTKEELAILVLEEFPEQEGESISIISINYLLNLL